MEETYGTLKMEKKEGIQRRILSPNGNGDGNKQNPIRGNNNYLGFAEFLKATFHAGTDLLFVVSYLILCFV